MFDDISLMKQLHTPDASAYAPNTGEDRTPDTITSISETTKGFPQNAD